MEQANETRLLNEVFNRLDLLAEKLGIAGSQIWDFTVRAKGIEARRDCIKAIGLLLVSVLFLAWATHVATMTIPREAPLASRVEVFNSEENAWKWTVNQSKGEISTEGAVYIASGFIFGMIGITIFMTGVGGIVDGMAKLRTTEYSAYQDIIGSI